MYNKKPKQSTYKFERASAIERGLASRLAEILKCQFVPAPEKCHYDAVYAKDGVTSIVECKVRTFPHDQYDSCLIEKPKYDRLMSYLYNNQCHKALYIMFYSDDVALVWNLDKQNPSWTTGEFVKTTMGDRSAKSKEVAYLPNSEATLIRLK